MMVKMNGRNMKILACVGSGGGGLSFCWTYMVTPMMIGQTPINRYSGGVQGIRPNRLTKVSGSAADRSLIQP